LWRPDNERGRRLEELEQFMAVVIVVLVTGLFFHLRFFSINIGFSTSGSS
jgi:hypothetical protein